MDQLQKYIESATAAARDKRMETSDQLTLGELIEKLEAIMQIQADRKKVNKEEAYVEFDFGTAIPTCLDSWRGSYAELALGYELTGYDNNENHFNKKLVSELLRECKKAVGKEFTGWKGGEFIMTPKTPVWVSNPGNSGNTAIIDVLDGGYHVVIITAYREY